MKKLNLLVISLLILSLVLAGCGSSASTGNSTQQNGQGEQSKQADPNKIYSIGAATAGGGYYILAGALQGVFKNAGINSSVQATGGGRQNAVLVDSGEVSLGLTNNIEAYDEWQTNNRKNIRSIATAFNGIHNFVVRADLPINGLSDLKDYQFGLTQKGSTHDLAGRQIFDILGIQPKKLVNAGKDDTNNMVKDGLLAGYFMTSGMPIPSIADLESSTKVKFLGFTDDEYKKVKEAAPWLSEDVIKAGTYKSVTQDIKTFSSWNVLIANKDVPDDVIYKMMDAMFNNAQELTNAYKTAEIKKELVDKLVIPLHPAAVKWYKDNGVEVPEKLIPPEAK